ncbi:MAG: PD40 domain-containing protein [Anaerolineae bacterium]|nr:PD40 domain-containing protein [Anaerolineae bacterium]
MRPSHTFILFALLMLSACAQSAGAPVSGMAFVSDRDGNQEIYVMQADGSNVRRLTDAASVDADPAFSPDGRQIAFRSRRDGTSDIFVMGSDGSQPRNLIQDDEDHAYDESDPVWSPDGQTLAFITPRFYTTVLLTTVINGAEIAKYQAATMPVTGGADSIELLGAVISDQRSLAWSPDGRFIVLSSLASHMIRNVDDDPLPYNLSLFERETGNVRVITDHHGNNTHPAWSHNGRFLAFQSSATGDLDIYVLEVESGALTNLTQNPAEDKHPCWSPDDAAIAFATDRDGNNEIYVINADGSGLRNLTQNPADDISPSWSPVP